MYACILQAYMRRFTNDKEGGRWEYRWEAKWGCLRVVVRWAGHLVTYL